MVGWPPFLVFLPILLSLLDGGEARVQEFSRQQVWQFVNSSLLLSLNDECRLALSRVEGYFEDETTSSKQGDFFAAAYGLGPSNQFTTRDQDRWVYKGYGCIKAAGEETSRSEHLHYCYSYDHDRSHDDAAISVCIPTTCASEAQSLITHWRHVTRPTEDTRPLTKPLCTRSRYEKMWWQKWWPMFDMTCNVMLILFVLIATCCHTSGEEEDKNKSFSSQLVVAFSLKNNLKQLVRLPKDKQSCITCLCGIRVVSMIWTLIGHSFAFIQAFTENIDEFKDEMVNNFANQWITNFTLSVDVFLVLSGTVLAYSFFWKYLSFPENTPKWSSGRFWLKFYRHRLVRLWPAYLYTLMCITLRISLSHTHPTWPSTETSEQCSKYWYQNVLFLNSILENRCLSWTWYIGTEFIYYLISPVFLLLLLNRPSYGVMLSILTILSSALLNAYTIYVRNFPPTQFVYRQPAIFNDDYVAHHLELYIKPQYRIGPYVFGILLGFFLAKSQKEAAGYPRSFTFIVCGWLFGASCLFVGMFGLYPALQGWNWPVYHVVYGALHRDVFAVGTCWIIYACHTGIGGLLDRFLSATVLLPLSNLSYSAYLWHMIGVMFTFLSAPYPLQYTGKLYIFSHVAVQFSVAYASALICSMMIEIPALNIEKLLLNRPSSSVKPSKY